MSENGDIQGKTIEATAEDLSALTKELVTDPEVLAKFGKKLMSYVGKSSGYIEGLPKSIKRRVRALRKLQLEVFKVESKFYEEVHRLEAKYAELCKPLFNKRSEIINAAKEPTDSECEWESEDEEHECHKEGGDCCDHEAMAGESDKPDILDSKFDEDTKGVPMFWYTALKNTPMVDQMVMSHDEEALKTLKDIRVTYNGESEEEMYFELHFEFEENRFFEDKILTKKYHLKLEPSTTYPMNYEGPEIYKSTGCTVNWKEGMNLTSVDDVKKMNPDVETEEFSSFFDLFKSCQMDDVADKDLSENERAIKENNNLMDFEVGQLLQSSIIPKAVLYFTGEMCVDDDEDDDDDEDEEGEGEYDEDEDPDYTPSKGKGQECKQQ